MAPDNIARALPEDGLADDWRLPPGVQTLSVWLRCGCRNTPQARPVHFTAYAYRLMQQGGLFGPDDIVGSYWCRRCKEPLAIRLRDLHWPSKVRRP